MKTSAVFKLEYWKELTKENESNPKDPEKLEENSYQVLDGEEVKDSKEIVKIQGELALMNTEDVNSNTQETNVTVILTSRKENGNTYSQISRAINSYNFKNPEDIRKKP
ncbi:hypothetical protein O181_107140 [Austropuccinia psidii MF-1]|uniref:Uncharacterized protein n=1 Tax=Austropuccinia psidii MF-1 TaxID=1389203 RepID=A0A9Q3PNB5_9BASI|nr:hypothetical protein [Austropuccinia psidii MF-1]